jgi:hypothetical protein
VMDENGYGGGIFPAPGGDNVVRAGGGGCCGVCAFSIRSLPARPPANWASRDMKDKKLILSL